MPRCEMTWLVDGPHPGCAEFAPPDVALCSNSARVVLVLKHERTPWTRKGRTVWRLCPGCRDEMVDDLATGMDPGTTLGREFPIGTDWRKEKAMRGTTRPCPCDCNSGGFCGGCGHAGCGGRR